MPEGSSAPSNSINRHHTASIRINQVMNIFKGVKVYNRSPERGGGELEFLVLAHKTTTEQQQQIKNNITTTKKQQQQQQ